MIIELHINDARDGRAELEATLAEMAQVHGLSAKLLFEVNLVLEELCTNCFHHGRADADHPITVRISLEPELLTLTIIDAGPPFDPTAVCPPDTSAALDRREPGKLGLLLVRHYTDSCTYSNVDGKNVLVLTKRIPKS